MIGVVPANATTVGRDTPPKEIAKVLRDDGCVITADLV